MINFVGHMIELCNSYAVKEIENEKIDTKDQFNFYFLTSYTFTAKNRFLIRCMLKKMNCPKV